LSTERTFRAAMKSILSRPVADEALHDMWVGLSAGNGRRIQPALLRYLDDRRDNAQRWQRALESYRGSTQFIWGPADPVSGGHVLPRLRERVPAAQFTVLDAAPVVGHYPQVEAPDEVATALLAQLTG
jgi:pimeloyl-ACP methyl ester carboxylesterase